MLTRTKILNSYIEERGYTRYLEICLDTDQWNFSQIICPSKKLVSATLDKDAYQANDYRIDLLEQAEEFDIILIDGRHNEEDVLADFAVAQRCLAPGGIILFHDCLPPDKWHQRDFSAYKKGEAWNGTVWKAVLRIFNETHHKCFVVDTDWGCGVIDFSADRQPDNHVLPGHLDYDLHYTMLHHYKMSVASFLRAKTEVFYHLACMGNWREVFQEQMETLHQAGFREIKLTVLGTKQEVYEMHRIEEEIGMQSKLIFQDTALSHYEQPAMKSIQSHAKDQDGFVLYLHSKGVSSPQDAGKAKWRRLMMRELVEKWEDCLPQLLQFDIVGVNWRDLHPVAHFCGNFWYATTKYLRTLADFEAYYHNPRYQIWDAVHSKRLGCEFWIGSGGRNPNLLSLKYRNVDFCNPHFWTDK